jgi:transposase
MALGKKKARQAALWIEPSHLRTHPAHPFYRRLNEILDQVHFDRYAERLCRKYYAATMGRPSIAPGVYFRCFFIGYLEGIDSERGIAYRVADSLSLRSFLGLDVGERTPDHSTLSKTRRLMSLGTHKALFGWALRQLAKAGLLRGQQIGIDATTLEANAALKSIVRRDSGASYEEHVAELMKAEGIEEPTPEQRQRYDRKRKKKSLSNQEWVNRHDPEARITQMKDGRTHLAYKAEQAVDLETGAIVALTIQPGDQGDTESARETLTDASQVLAPLAGQAAEGEAVGPAPGVAERCMESVVADKGYHSRELVCDLVQAGVRTVISEPDRGRQHWREQAAEQQAVYANRRRLRSESGKRLLRRRGEHLERAGAHLYDTGGMRRVHLRGKENIAKRVMVHAAAFNLSLILRRIIGVGTPRQAADRLRLLFSGMLSLNLGPELTCWLWVAAFSSREAGHSQDCAECQMAPLSTGC